MCIINIDSSFLVMPSITIFYQVDKKITLPKGALDSKRLRTTAPNSCFDPHLNIRATLMQMSRSLRWFSRIKQRVKNALLDRKEGRDSDWSAIFLKAAVT